MVYIQKSLLEKLISRVKKLVTLSDPLTCT